MTDQPWTAPVARHHLDAEVAVPGSKSLTNRYLLLAAIADEPTHLVAPLHSRDSALMIDALRALGAEITVEAGGDVHVVPAARILGGAAIDCGLAGTVMRFVPPLAAFADGDVHLDGDERARERPMDGVIDGLRGLGVEVSHDGAPTRTLPFTVHGSGEVLGGEVTIDASVSSQFVSALLLVAPRMREGLDLRHVGERLPSQAHIDMTLEVLRARGVEAREIAPGHWRVAPGPVAGGRIVVEPDLSNAGPFVVAALAAGGTVRIPHWPTATTQPGDDLREILTRMGGTVSHAADGTLSVSGSGTVHGIDLDLTRAGELAPTIAALAVLADSPTRLRGIGHLRGHETDRLAALVTEITRLGGTAHELPDGLEITPAPLHGAVVETYHDHRMATFAAVVGLVVPGVEIVDVATTAKTLPDFTGMWQRMLAGSAAGAG